MKYQATIKKVKDGNGISFYCGDIEFENSYSRGWTCGDTWREFKAAVKEEFNADLPKVSKLDFFPISDHEDMALFCGSAPLFCILVDGEEMYPYDCMSYANREDAEYQVECMIKNDGIAAERITIKIV